MLDAMKLIESWGLLFDGTTIVWRKIGQNKHNESVFPPCKRSTVPSVIEPYVGAGWTSAHCYEFLLRAKKSSTIPSPFRTD